MKKSKSVLCILLAVIMLNGCQAVVGANPQPVNTSSDSIELETFYDDYKVYTKYLTPVKYNMKDISYEYVDASEGLHGIFVYNNSKDLFVTGVFNYYDSPIKFAPLASWSRQMILIRPTGYDDMVMADKDSEEYYNVTDVKAYSFDYDATIKYDYSNAGKFGRYSEIVIDETYTTDDVKSIAQREYIIRALTGNQNSTIYYFDNSITRAEDESENEYHEKAVYATIFNFHDKKITIVKGNNPYGPGTPNIIDTITME